MRYIEYSTLTNVQRKKLESKGYHCYSLSDAGEESYIRKHTNVNHYADIVTDFSLNDYMDSEGYWNYSEFISLDAGKIPYEEVRDIVGVYLNHHYKVDICGNTYIYSFWAEGENEIKKHLDELKKEEKKKGFEYSPLNSEEYWSLYYKIPFYNVKQFEL